MTMDEADDLLVKLRLLAREESKAEAAALERAYEILNILDGKAGGLVTLNTFMGAFPAAAVAYFRGKTDFLHIAGLYLSFVLVMLLVVSAIFCFRIVRINWPFLYFIDAGGGKEFSDKELKELSHVIVARTRYYSAAWWITLLSLAGLAILAFLYAIS